MEFTNALYRYTEGSYDIEVAKDCIRTLLLLLAPIAPHFSEELWERIGGEYSIFNQDFPKFDEKHLVMDEITYPLQVNGKLKDRFALPADYSEEQIREYVLDKYSDIFEGMEIVKLIIVPKRIVNAVIRPKK